MNRRYDTTKRCGELPIRKEFSLDEDNLAKDGNLCYLGDCGLFLKVSEDGSSVLLSRNFVNQATSVMKPIAASLTSAAKCPPIHTRGG